MSDLSLPPDIKALVPWTYNGHGTMFLAMDKKTKMKCIARIIGGNRESASFRKLNNPYIATCSFIVEKNNPGQLSTRVALLDYCDGGTLEALLKQPENYYGLAENDFSLVFLHIAQALYYLYEQKIEHGPVAASDILLYRDGNGSFVCKLAGVEKWKRYTSQNQNEAAFRDLTEFVLLVYQCVVGWPIASEASLEKISACSLPSVMSNIPNIHSSPLPIWMKEVVAEMLGLVVYRSKSPNKIFTELRKAFDGRLEVFDINAATLLKPKRSRYDEDLHVALLNVGCSCTDPKVLKHGSARVLLPAGLGAKPREIYCPEEGPEPLANMYRILRTTELCVDEQRRCLDARRCMIENIKEKMTGSDEPEELRSLIRDLEQHKISTCVNEGCIHGVKVAISDVKHLKDRQKMEDQELMLRTCVLKCIKKTRQLHSMVYRDMRKLNQVAVKLDPGLKNISSDLAS